MRLTLCASILALGCASSWSAAGEPDTLDPQTLKLSSRPAWQGRLDFIARYGLSLAPLRHNRDSTLVLGMHPKGYFGIFLVPRSD
jgi:hypothetical protein